MKTFIFSVIVALIVVFGSLWAAQAQAYTPEDVLTAVNKNRSTPLVMNPELSKAAEEKAHMLISCGCFTHTPNGVRFTTHIQDHKIAYLTAGENLGLGFKNVTNLNKAWMESPSHRANVLGSYTQTGIAVMKGMYQGKEAIYVVQLFITPQ